MAWRQVGGSSLSSLGGTATVLLQKSSSQTSIPTSCANLRGPCGGDWRSRLLSRVAAHSLRSPPARSTRETTEARRQRRLTELSALFVVRSWLLQNAMNLSRV